MLLDLDAEYRFLIRVLGSWALAYGLTDRVIPEYAGLAPDREHPMLRVANVVLFRSQGRIHVQRDLGSELYCETFRWDEWGAVLVDRYQLR